MTATVARVGGRPPTGDAFALTATGHVPLRIVIVASPAESRPLGLVSD